MQSSFKQLSARGFLSKGTEEEYAGLPLPDKIRLLQSDIAAERTLGAGLLSSIQGIKVINQLIEALRVEKKIYAKIEICNALAAHGQDAVKPLIAQLGKIGTNQHKVVPQEKFKKNNYPLPRDIIARTLGNMGTIALPDLLALLTVTPDARQLSEAIDAIGYICFYNRQEGDAFEKVKTCFAEYVEHDLIRWKIYRSISAFPQGKSFLIAQRQTEKQIPIRNEIERSLRIIEKRNIC